jgi:hypothetical protein
MQGQSVDDLEKHSTTTPFISFAGAAGEAKISTT